MTKFIFWNFNLRSVERHINLGIIKNILVFGLPEENQVYVVYQFIGLFGDKHDLEEYDDLSNVRQDYANRTRNEVDKIIRENF